MIGTDFSPVAIESARRIAPAQNVTFEVQDAQALTYNDNTFDLIVCCETVEHLLDAPCALREFARVLCPDGTLLLTFPNYMSLVGLHRLYLKARRADNMEDGQPIANFTTYLQLRRWVRAASFTIKATRGRGHYLPLPGRVGPPLDLTKGRPHSRLASKLIAAHVLIHATASKPTAV